MWRFVTHHFATPETMERAERWLIQNGFGSDQIEVHHERSPWISVLATPERTTEAMQIIKAAEYRDPKGWPSFWDLSRNLSAHTEMPVTDPDHGGAVIFVKPTAVGWHPSD